MFYVIDGYRGESREINEGLAKLFTYARLVDEPWIFCEVTVDGVEDMFRYSWYSPEGFGMVLYEGSEGDVVVAAAWAYPSRELGKPHTITPYLSPYLPEWLVRDVLTSLLSWCRYALERQGALGIAKVYVGLEGGFLHVTLKKYLGVGGVEGTYATLMRFSGSITEYSVPKEYVIREFREGDCRGIAEVHNRAFSTYEFFTPWTAEDVRRFYDFFRRHFKFKVLVAEHVESGEIAGFCDGRVFKALDDGVSAEVTTVAVDPKHRGKGLGRALVAMMVNELMGAGAQLERTYLISMHGLERFYRGLGFREYRRFMYLLTPLPYLPSSLTNYRPLP